MEIFDSLKMTLYITPILQKYVKGVFMKLGSTLSKVYAIANQGSLERYEAAKAIQEILLSGETLETKSTLAMVILAKLDKEARTDAHISLAERIGHLSSEEKKTYYPALAAALFKSVKLFTRDEQFYLLKEVHHFSGDNMDMKEKAKAARDQLLEDAPVHEKYDLALKMHEFASNDARFLATALENIGDIPAQRYDRAMRIHNSAQYKTGFGQIAVDALQIAISTVPKLEDGKRYGPAIRVAGELRHRTWHSAHDNDHEIDLPQESGQKTALLRIAMDDLATSLENPNDLKEHCLKVYKIYQQTKKGSDLEGQTKVEFKNSLLKFLSHEPTDKPYSDHLNQHSKALQWGRTRHQEDLLLAEMVQDIVLEDIQKRKGQNKLNILTDTYEYLKRDHHDFAETIGDEIIMHLRSLKAQERLEASIALLSKDYWDTNNGYLMDLLKPVQKIITRAFSIVDAKLADPEKRYELAKQTYDVLERTEYKKTEPFLKIMAETVSSLPEDKKFDAYWRLNRRASFHDLNEIELETYAYLVKAVTKLEPEKQYARAYHMSQWSINTEETAEQLHNMVFEAIGKLPLAAQEAAAKDLRLSVRDSIHDKKDAKQEDILAYTQEILDRAEAAKHPPLTPEQFIAKMSIVPVARPLNQRAPTLDFTSGE